MNLFLVHPTQFHLTVRKLNPLADGEAPYGDHHPDIDVGRCQIVHELAHNLSRATSRLPSLEDA